MRLACAALLLLAAPLAAQQPPAEEVAARRLVLDASRALQAGNAARFLSYFDKRETPQFAQLRENVLALLASKSVASSVETGKIEVEGERAQVEVDWLIQLTPAEGIGPAEQRRERVTVGIRLGGKPKITALEPIALFQP